MPDIKPGDFTDDALLKLEDKHGSARAAVRQLGGDWSGSWGRRFAAIHDDQDTEADETSSETIDIPDKPRKADFATLYLLRQKHGSAEAAVEAMGVEWDAWWERTYEMVGDAEEEYIVTQEQYYEAKSPEALINNLKRPPEGWEANVYEQMTSLGETLQDIETEQYEADITIETDTPIGIAVTSDQHLGNMGTDHRLLGQVVDTIVDTPGLFVCDDGDSIDNFVALSHEMGRYEQLIRPRYQKQLARWIWMRWAPKLLANTGGQHEYFEKRVSDFDTAEYLARKGNAVFLGPGGKLNLQIGDQYYIIGMWHKFRGTSIYDRTAAAKRCFREHGPFDITITADKHEPAISYCNEQGQWRAFVQAGTFKVRDSYARSLGYETANPRDYIAVPLVICWPDRRKLWVTLDFFGGVDYLQFLRGNTNAKPTEHTTAQ